MAKDINTVLRKKALETNDLMLYLLANQEGNIDIWGYLQEYIKNNDLGNLEISDEVSRNLEQTFKANKRRARQLEKWILEEDKVKNPTAVEKTIQESYKKELDLLNEYALQILRDFLGVK